MKRKNLDELGVREINPYEFLAQVYAEPHVIALGVYQTFEHAKSAFTTVCKRLVKQGTAVNVSTGSPALINDPSDDTAAPSWAHQDEHAGRGSPRRGSAVLSPSFNGSNNLRSILSPTQPRTAGRSADHSLQVRSSFLSPCLSPGQGGSGRASTSPLVNPTKTTLAERLEAVATHRGVPKDDSDDAMGVQAVSTARGLLLGLLDARAGASMMDEDETEYGREGVDEAEPNGGEDDVIPLKGLRSEGHPAPGNHALAAISDASVAPMAVVLGAAAELQAKEVNMRHDRTQTAPASSPTDSITAKSAGKVARHGMDPRLSVSAIERPHRDDFDGAMIGSLEPIPGSVADDDMSCAAAIGEKSFQFYSSSALNSSVPPLHVPWEVREGDAEDEEVQTCRYFEVDLTFALAMHEAREHSEIDEELRKEYRTDCMEIIFGWQSCPAGPRPASLARLDPNFNSMNEHVYWDWPDASMHAVHAARQIMIYCMGLEAVAELVSVSGTELTPKKKKDLVNAVKPAMGSLRHPAYRNSNAILEAALRPLYTKDARKLTPGKKAMLAYFILSRPRERLLLRGPAISVVAFADTPSAAMHGGTSAAPPAGTEVKAAPRADVEATATNTRATTGATTDENDYGAGAGARDSTCAAAAGLQILEAQVHCHITASAVRFTRFASTADKLCFHFSRHNIKERVMASRMGIEADDLHTFLQMCHVTHGMWSEKDTETDAESEAEGSRVGGAGTGSVISAALRNEASMPMALFMQIQSRVQRVIEDLRNHNFRINKPGQYGLLPWYNAGLQSITEGANCTVKFTGYGSSSTKVACQAQMCSAFFLSRKLLGACKVAEKKVKATLRKLIGKQKGKAGRKSKKGETGKIAPAKVVAVARKPVQREKATSLSAAPPASKLGLLSAYVDTSPELPATIDPDRCTVCGLSREFSAEEIAAAAGLHSVTMHKCKAFPHTMLQCSGCHIRVHEACYGRLGVLDDDKYNDANMGSWMCDMCTPSGAGVGFSNAGVFCPICDRPVCTNEQNRKLASHRCADGSAAHVICLATNQMVRYDYGKRLHMENADVSMLSLSKASKESKVCCLCSIKSPVDCLLITGWDSRPGNGPLQYVHPSCAMEHGLLVATKYTFGCAADLGTGSYPIPPLTTHATLGALAVIRSEAQSYSIAAFCDFDARIPLNRAAKAAAHFSSNEYFKCALPKEYPTPGQLHMLALQHGSIKLHTYKKRKEDWDKRLAAHQKIAAGPVVRSSSEFMSCTSTEEAALVSEGKIIVKEELRLALEVAAIDTIQSDLFSGTKLRARFSAGIPFMPGMFMFQVHSLQPKAEGDSENTVAPPSTDDMMVDAGSGTRSESNTTQRPISPATAAASIRDRPSPPVDSFVAAASAPAAIASNPRFKPPVVAPAQAQLAQPFIDSVVTFLKKIHRKGAPIALRVADAMRKGTDADGVNTGVIAAVKAALMTYEVEGADKAAREATTAAAEAWEAIASGSNTDSSAAGLVKVAPANFSSAPKPHENVPAPAPALIKVESSVDTAAKEEADSMMAERAGDGLSSSSSSHKAAASDRSVASKPQERIPELASASAIASQIPPVVAPVQPAQPFIDSVVTFLKKIHRKGAPIALRVADAMRKGTDADGVNTGVIAAVKAALMTYEVEGADKAAREATTAAAEAWEACAGGKNVEGAAHDKQGPLATTADSFGSIGSQPMASQPISLSNGAGAARGAAGSACALLNPAMLNLLQQICVPVESSSRKRKEPHAQRLTSILYHEDEDENGVEVEVDAVKGSNGNVKRRQVDVGADAAPTVSPSGARGTEDALVAPAYAAASIHAMEVENEVGQSDSGPRTGSGSSKRRSTRGHGNGHTEHSALM